MTKFKTEKRPAKVGERILITDATPIYSGDYYENGDVLTVTQADVSDEGDVRTSETKTYIDYFEYEVITVETNEIGGDKMNVGIIEKMQAELDELKAKVAALESAGRHRQVAEAIAELPRVKSTQEIRDEIVAKAKRDVEELIAHGRDVIKVGGTDGNNTYRESFYWVEFNVNSQKRTVVALVGLGENRRYFPEVKHKGIAKCAPNDCINSHIGRAISLRRALGLTVPSEYLQAPQPTEVRAGDIIRWDDATDSIFKIADKVENRYDFEVVRTNLPETSGYRTGLLLYEKGLYATIIDDSRANAEQKVTQ